MEGERVMSIQSTPHISRSIILLVSLLFSSFSFSQDEDRLALLERRLAALEHRLVVQEDIQKVRAVAFSYAYYMDNVLYDQVKAMISKNAEYCEFSGYGRYEGYKGCMKVWDELIGKPLGADDGQLAFGRLAKHYMLKDVITVSADGKTAQGRFDYLSMGGAFGNTDRTGSQIGIYNFGFVKEEGVWKISKFWLVFDTINYNQRDWAVNPKIRCPSERVPPDAPHSFYHPFPETGVVPFHYPNPVTGEEVPAPITDQRYWIGNWPGEFGGPCGIRAELESAAKNK